jgi:DNA-binding MarR family transcriptional regulator
MEARKRSTPITPRRLGLTINCAARTVDRAMADRNLTAKGDALSAAILDLFKVTSLFMASGDRLVAHLGLTSARWQVLGAIIAAERPEPVAWLARDMGANRQNVQRIVNDLLGEGLVVLEDNPRHRRAQLVVLTAKGERAYAAAMKLGAPWMNELVAELPLKDIATFRRVLMELRRKLEVEGTAGHGVLDGTVEVVDGSAMRRRVR